MISHSDPRGWADHAGLNASGGPTGALSQSGSRFRHFTGRDSGARKLDYLQPAAGRVAEAVSGGEMPPLQYTLLHPGARLSGSEKQGLIDGLAGTFQQDPPGR